MMGDTPEILEKRALDYHSQCLGKIEMMSKTPVSNIGELSLAYTPLVSAPCRRIAACPNLAYKYTNKGNSVAIVTDGTAVLGLKDIGPLAAMPVMEGKAILMKMLAGVDGYPVCLSTKDPDRIVDTVKCIEPSYAGINLEDISAPRCFEIESRLKKELDIPVFHDDQHGTAVVVLAGLINALKLVDKQLKDVRILFNGAGASAIACAKFLMTAGARDVIMCDSKGLIYEGRKEGMNPYKDQMASLTNREHMTGGLESAFDGSDIFIGLSVAGLVSQKMIRSMSDDAIVFALANPIPEIMPDKAQAAGAKIVATGRSDFPNQINNVLGFPGIFRAALDTQAKDINERMKLAASNAIASAVPDHKLSTKMIIPSPLDPDVMAIEAGQVARAAIESKLARRDIEPEQVQENLRTLASRARKSHELCWGRSKKP